MGSKYTKQRNQVTINRLGERSSLVYSSSSPKATSSNVTLQQPLGDLSYITSDIIADPATRDVSVSSDDDLTEEPDSLTVEFAESSPAESFELDGDIFANGNITFFFDGVLDLGGHYLEASENIIFSSKTGGYVIAESHLEMVAGGDITIDVPFHIYRNITYSQRRLIVQPTAIHTIIRANGSFNLTEPIDYIGEDGTTTHILHIYSESVELTNEAAIYGNFTTDILHLQRICPGYAECVMRLGNRINNYKGKDPVYLTNEDLGRMVTTGKLYLGDIKYWSDEEHGVNTLNVSNINILSENVGEIYLTALASNGTIEFSGGSSEFGSNIIIEAERDIRVETSVNALAKLDLIVDATCIHGGVLIVDRLGVLQGNDVYITAADLNLHNLSFVISNTNISITEQCSFNRSILIGNETAGSQMTLTKHEFGRIASQNVVLISLNGDILSSAFAQVLMAPNITSAINFIALNGTLSFSGEAKSSFRKSNMKAKSMDVLSGVETTDGQLQFNLHGGKLQISHCTVRAEKLLEFNGLGEMTILSPVTISAGLAIDSNIPVLVNRTNRDQSVILEATETLSINSDITVTGSATGEFFTRLKFMAGDIMISSASKLTASEEHDYIVFTPFCKSDATSCILYLGIKDDGLTGFHLSSAEINRVTTAGDRKSVV